MPKKKEGDAHTFPRDGDDENGWDSDMDGEDEEVEKEGDNTRICPVCGKKQLEYVGEVKYLSQLPKELYVYEYDRDNHEMAKKRANRDELSWFCSPLMFELGESDQSICDFMRMIKTMHELSPANFGCSLF